MDTFRDFEGLRFERPRIRRLPGWLIPLVGVPVIFSLFWIVLPRQAMYWLLLILLPVLVWVAGFGRRQAVAALIVFLERLEDL